MHVKGFFRLKESPNAWVLASLWNGTYYNSSAEGVSIFDAKKLSACFPAC